eukprot:COSAG02_NODE_124_length_35047_cov_31.554179_15_plen_97_part_00
MIRNPPASAFHCPVGREMPGAKVEDDVNRDCLPTHEQIVSALQSKRVMSRQQVQSAARSMLTVDVHGQLKPPGQVEGDFFRVVVEAHSKRDDKCDI